MLNRAKYNVCKMEEAVEMVNECLTKKRSISFFGDLDADIGKSLNMAKYNVCKMDEVVEMIKGVFN